MCPDAVTPFACRYPCASAACSGPESNSETVVKTIMHHCRKLSSDFCSQVGAVVLFNWPFNSITITAASRPMDDICFTVTTSFPLHFPPAVPDSTSGFAASVQAGRPLETKSDLQLPRRVHPSEQHQSNSLARTAGGPHCRKTKPCPRPSSDGMSPLRTRA